MSGGSGFRGTRSTSAFGRGAEDNSHSHGGSQQPSKVSDKKRVSTSLFALFAAFVVLASKIWAFVVYVFKKQTRAVRLL